MLLILHGTMVKTQKFKKPAYVGDPLNSARIFNQLGADELIILDISETRSKSNLGIDFDLIQSLASECFMPLTYGGRIRSVEDAKKLIRIGVEKVSLNSSALSNPELINQTAAELGVSSTVVAVDVRINPVNKKFMVVRNAGRKSTNIVAVDWIAECIERGAGEILLTDVTREGTWGGMRQELIALSNQISEVPVILHGGTASYNEATEILEVPKVSGLGIGNLVCYQKKGCGILVNYPEQIFD